MLLPRHTSKVQPYGSQATSKPSRLRPPGLRLKTSSLDLVPSDEKAQAMASADWRKMAPDSGLGGNLRQVSDENSRHPSEPNDDFYSPLVLEMKPMNTGSKSQCRNLRHPTSGVAWEAISSAPGCGFRREETRTSEPSSLPSPFLKACEPSLQDTMMVRLKAIKPMDVSINGDIITLPNKYSLDVTPVDIQEPDAACFMTRERGDMLATLKLLKPKARLRRMKSELHEESVLEDLDNFLSQQTGKHSKAATSRQEVQRQYRGSSEHRSSYDSGISNSFESSSLEKELPSGAPHNSPVEVDRFQTLLSRLHLTTETREPSQPPAAPSSIETSRPDARVLDPAIIVAKVKDEECEETPGSSERGPRVCNFFGRDSALLFGKGKRAQKSHDSGYSTFHPMRQDSEGSAKTKGEEHSGFTGQKRKEDSTSTSTTSTRLNPTAAEFKSVTRADPRSEVKDDFKPAVEGYSAPPWTPKRLTRPSLNSVFPGVLEGYGGPTQTVPFVADDGLQRNPWKARGPPAEPVWVPEPRQSSIPEMALQQPPVAPVAMAPLPIVDPDGKGARPVFPVTQKPRDHDPVKQQAYESYLEWRKANEPGYHMKCKMRQAHRVVRQYQQQAQTSDWKTVAGQAKAAAGALEAQAVEEKKRSKEAALKEQFKLSVKRMAESSGASEKKEQPHLGSNNGKQAANTACDQQTLVI
ncbi:hypothetical protein QBC41DRAFT_388422 [Cercophora samala]|uniref:Uncharacterized protein n=1 Tax=Cercophora samala TaxID=330535 RepID=A0AA39ZGH2_9PEZI|nr:hypothetical protein QBC41DRAFT_388422 [Cercophora samala]